MIEESWSDSTGSYIRIRGDEEDRISDRILHKHCIGGILPMETEHINGHREYVYEVSGYHSLGEVMEETPLSETQWISILEQLVNLIGELEAYLLDGEHLVIREDMLWIRGERADVFRKPELRGIYVPEHREKLGVALGSLAEKALRHPECDRKASEFIYRLHAICMSEQMTVRSLRSFLREESGTVVETAETTIEKNTEKKTIGRSIINKKTIKRLGGVQRLNRVTAKREGVPIRLPVLLLLAGIAIPIILMCLGLFTSETTGKIDFTSLAAAFLFFGAAGGYGAWRLWPTKPSSVIWEEDEEPGVCLIPGREGSRPLAVEQFPWRLGRDGKQCDAVIEDEDISPVHACIKRESQAVLLVDQESETGTFHNEARLVPWTPVRLKDGDRVAFGRVSYVVEITS